MACPEMAPVRSAVKKFEERYTADNPGVQIAKTLTKLRISRGGGSHYGGIDKLHGVPDAYEPLCTPHKDGFAQ